MYIHAGQDVDTANEEVFSVLKIGQNVSTPIGKGIIVDIEIQAGRYGDRIELEPPAITVELTKPKKDQPKRVVVCMCKLGLADKEHEAILRKEFSRLWPPITDDIPEETRMLVDVSKEFSQEVSSFKKRLWNMQLSASAGLDITALQRAAYVTYVQLATQLPSSSMCVAKLEPGSVVSELGGESFGESAVVLLQVPSGDAESKVLVYLPETNELKFIVVPNDAESVVHETEPVGLVPTVYDEQRVHEDIPAIRTLPNSYLPPDPNYPSSITQTIWRPTRRMTPIRYYNVKKGGAPMSLERELQPGHRQQWPPRDTVNYPVPDSVPLNTQDPPYRSGVEVYEYDPEHRGPNAEPLIPSTPELKTQALLFWRGYQLAREHRTVSGEPAHLNLSVDQYAAVFAAENSMDLKQIWLLLRYMAQHNFFTQSVPDSFKKNFAAELYQYRTQFTPDA